jgi:hypothetical protein
MAPIGDQIASWIAEDKSGVALKKQAYFLELIADRCERECDDTMTLAHTHDL